MREDWKKYFQFLLASTISLIVSSIFAVLLVFTTRQIEYSFNINIGKYPESDLMYLPLEQIILISLVLFVFLTIVFYFVIGYVREKKK